MSSLIFDCLLERLMLYNSGRPLNLRIATGYKAFMRTDPKVVTPECFYRGSSSNFAWIPDSSFRE
jgi:hypothetical protein